MEDNKIIIVQDRNTGNYTVNINGKENMTYKKTLPQNIIIKEIIADFFNNNSITEISDEFVFGNIRCWKFKSSYTSLIFKSYDLQDEFTKLKGDYCSNRMDFIYKHPFIKEYQINCIDAISPNNKSSYQMADNRILLNVFYDCYNEKIVEFDKLFIQKVIHDKLSNCGCIEIHWTGFEEYSEKYGEYVFFYKLECGEYTFSTQSPIVYRIIDKIVKEYNKSKEKYKSRQLKMEGF